MRLIIELENDDDLSKAEKLIKLVKFSSVEKKVNKKDKIKSLLEFADKNSFHVKEVDIPSREERNAR
jgi:hypothetical protein